MTNSSFWMSMGNGFTSRFPLPCGGNLDVNPFPIGIQKLEFEFLDADGEWIHVQISPARQGKSGRESIPHRHPETRIRHRRWPRRERWSLPSRAPGRACMYSSRLHDSV